MLELLPDVRKIFAESVNVKMPKPNWLKKQITASPIRDEVQHLLAAQKMNTICTEAGCPNQMECFATRTATFLILGKQCTRNCRFCRVSHGQPDPPDPTEPERVAATALRLGLTYVVLTSVSRDDLPDYGASAFVQTIQALRTTRPDTRVEVLIPDFMGTEAALNRVVQARPDVLNHNLETVPRLYATVRPQAVYQRSLKVIHTAMALNPNLITKSGLMLGLGETLAEIEKTMEDLLAAGCRILTLGQYLQPGQEQLPVFRYVEPEVFATLKQRALAMGFSAVAAGPFVRSSYQAQNAFETVREIHSRKHSR